jgi:putative transposase
MLGRYLRKYEVPLVGYSLMDNHVHLAPVPGRSDSLSTAIGRTALDYSRWFQVRRHQTGHLWQSRFFSCAVEDERIPQVLLYIELNPVRAGLVQCAWEWNWSSAKAHVTGVDPMGILDMDYWSDKAPAGDWKALLLAAVKDEESIKGIRAATSTGRPWGSDDFISSAERQLGRILRPQRQGKR